MTEVVLRWMTAAAVAGGLVGQAVLQQSLSHQNDVRAVRKLHLTPSSLAFRLAAGGVKEAAADALWLATLPRLGARWVEPDRKAQWIEATTTVMLDANPRALNPTLYASKFLELVRLDEPAIDRLLVRAMYAEQRAPFGERKRVNGDDWQLPHELMMNRYQQYFRMGKETALSEAIAWGTVASKKPNCPRIIIDFVSSLEARRGNELAGWLLYLTIKEQTLNEDFKDDYLKEANLQRRIRLLAWARDFEKEENRFPASLEEALSRASPSTRQTLRLNPEVDRIFREGVEFVPETRDIVIAELVEFQEAWQRRRLEDQMLYFEAENGRPPESLADVAEMGRIPTAPRHGTRWEFDVEKSEWNVVPFPEDRRTFSTWR